MIFTSFNDVIFPARLGTYQLSTERVVGIDINKNTLYATVIVYQGRSITVEKVVQYPLEEHSTLSYAEQVQHTLKLLLKEIKAVTTIRISFPSSRLVFKELNVPFSDPEKISRTIGFELEPYLPFNIAEAVISFIVIKQDQKQNKTTILASAAPYQQVEEYIQTVGNGAQENQLSIDIFDLYNLYCMTYPVPTTKVEVFIYIDISSTRLLYIVDGKLTFSRTITKGMSDWAQSLAAITHTSPAQALESLITFGIQDTGKEGYLATVETVLNEFMHQLRFTIESFNNLMHSIDAAATLPHLIIGGPGAELINLVTFAHHILEWPSQLFDANLLKNNGISFKTGVVINQNNLLSVATALVSSLNRSVTLNRVAVENQERSLLTKQLITSMALLLSLLSVGVGDLWWQSRKLRKAAQEAEKNTITALSREQLTTKKSLPEAFKEAQEMVKTQEDIWFSFSAQTRFSFLHYLQQLTSIIDRAGLGLKLQRFIINQQENSLTLSGQVKDFDALKKLEQDLRHSNMFIYVPSMQSIKFDVTLSLKKNPQE